MTTGLDTHTFVLPDELSATRPAEARGLARDQVRMMVSDAGVLTHARFRELPRFLRAGDLVVVNNSAMLTAAVDARYADEAAVVHFSTWLDDGRWVVELRDPAGTPWRGHAVKPGARLILPSNHIAILNEPWLSGTDRLWIADIVAGHRPARDRPTIGGESAVAAGAKADRADVDVRELLARHGRPITYSYLSERWSASYYRTVFGLEPGSAEMPSAGRPFTEALVTELVAGGVGLAPITLHTGVSSPEAGEPPSPERFAVPEMTARLVNATHAAGGRVVAVGTTVTRALESAVDAAGSVRAAGGWTDLVLDGSRPARAVDGLITGWHAPGASHLHLLESVAGARVVREAYRAALESGYLWHEFGDTALLFRD
ncbi:S-adenosylmethionine:tRNA ribosyltransferase-isomerase [Nocardia sp. CDC160]|uniref:S-adenosylmethionine:tRNA ribosyltransferase-isomerase n=1 Tax=Nocardia sp. CDC160 TaxID=3112166 RepID=UPI002DB9A974|nr:S-adenosylmethionine:tRNA ribosyltransferase-isomerase [Nocardia sp. CDC160]MEC3915203.1 S-adenosylmethionine:tRNA ribosyltransferase-isomerase [Nocardia sp. CDC160]